MIVDRILISSAICVFSLAAASCSSKSTSESTTGEAGPEDPANFRRPEIVDARIDQIVSAAGDVIENPVAGQPFTVSGSFAISEGTNPDPPAVIVKIRDRGGVIHNSASARSVKQDDGRYVFDAEIRSLQQAGSFNLEVRVRGETIDERSVEVRLD